ncbi:amino acid permease [Streptomyces sp. NBC_01728]|uniref:amino acid permease n=1 Tax=unclassified Streptomyces TaxID=2593676 RepID=UPI00224DA71F|nr:MULTISPECIES: amino acid permease [unclassified Streptomyces]MCX4452368.1 amino acid permease [Streptomyces sp. NBC_01719]MCX4491728.1 amino acid permease [Streptomyces sp. NBC_01728]
MTLPKTAPDVAAVPSAAVRRRGPRRSVLFFAFAFAVIADPVSSVAYAIEAALRALHGDLALLLPTMSLVVGLVVVVTANYWQLVRRFPKGGGAAAAAGRAFGPRWTFLPIGALVVDFVLTIGISIAAAASAVIALFPGLAPLRIPLALVLLVVVAGLTWFGHGGRLLFAVMTVAFVVISVAVLVLGFTAPHATDHAATTADPGRSAMLAVVLAFPVAMALATGVEAPSTAIAQLGQLDDTQRRRFGRGTLALLVVIVGGLTLALTALAVRLHIGIPGTDSTQIADIAHAAAGPGRLYGAFQLTSSLLLLAAASSSFQAGPGLLKALAGTDGRPGVLPPVLGRANRHHTPYWSVVVYLAAAALIIVASAGQEQELVLFYAVAVFVSFLVGLVAMARFARRENRTALAWINSLAAAAVAFTLGVNLLRGWPMLSLAATLLIAGGLYTRWTRAGRPTGIEDVEAHAEAD